MAIKLSPKLVFNPGFVLFAKSEWNKAAIVKTPENLTEGFRNSFYRHPKFTMVVENYSLQSETLHMQCGLVSASAVPTDGTLDVTISAPQPVFHGYDTTSRKIKVNLSAANYEDAFNKICTLMILADGAVSAIAELNRALDQPHDGKIFK